MAESPYQRSGEHALDLRWGNAECRRKHPLWLISEGYAYCYEEKIDSWYAWRLAEPAQGTAYWQPEILWDGQSVWLGRYSFPTKSDLLDFIQRDMDAHNAIYERIPVSAS